MQCFIDLRTSLISYSALYYASTTSTLQQPNCKPFALTAHTHIRVHNSNPPHRTSISINYLTHIIILITIITRTALLIASS